MKWEQLALTAAEYESHPPRGGWIEISVRRIRPGSSPGPTPHGVGGLKYRFKDIYTAMGWSHPPRGGWIEIGIRASWAAWVTVPPPTGWVD